MKLALWALTAHNAWLQLAPALPRQLDWLKARVFQLSHPAPGALMDCSGCVQAVADRAQPSALKPAFQGARSKRDSLEREGS